MLTGKEGGVGGKKGVMPGSPRGENERELVRGDSGNIKKAEWREVGLERRAGYFQDRFTKSCKNVEGGEERWICSTPKK